MKNTPRTSRPFVSNILTNSDFTAGLDRGHFLSRTGNCKTLVEADGYCRGEGVGTVVLNRLEDALRHGDPIRGVIVNACTNHIAEVASITRPCSSAQRDPFVKVLGGLEPANVTYVEIHGTGAQVGDATGMTSVLEAIAPTQSPRALSESLVYLGSVKPTLGHGEAAAGITSLIKLLLMMQAKLIPPHTGIKNRISRNFPDDLEGRGVRIAKAPVRWKRIGGPRAAILNNFSATGGNTTLLDTARWAIR
ncbi:thiolase-like protein [Xylaria intraflava]|nr:thiolase-like protein [Xylaria intraflava]